MLVIPLSSRAAASSSPQVNSTIIASSSAGIFSFPHGAMERNGMIILGTVHTNPGEIILFPDIRDLSIFISTTTPGFTDLASVDYDAVHGRYYFVSSRVDDKHLEILSVDPVTLSWQPVYEFPSVSNIGFSTINTDGMYVYAATQSLPPYILKLKISDWSLVLSRIFPNALGGFHSAAFHTYADRSEWYVNTFSVPTQFFKINPATFDAVSIKLPKSFEVTDDVYFRQLNNQGGIVYEVSEKGSGLDAINTATLTDRHIEAPSSYGLYSDGNNLFVLNSFTNSITEYKGFHLSSPTTIPISFPSPANEGFPGELPGSGFFSTFATSSSLYEFSTGLGKGKISAHLGK